MLRKLPLLLPALVATGLGSPYQALAQLMPVPHNNSHGPAIISHGPPINEIVANRIADTQALVTFLVNNNGAGFASRLKVSKQPTMTGATVYDQQQPSYAGSGIWCTTQLSGLSPSTVYYYQGSATSANGTTTTSIQSFTTTSAPPGMQFLDTPKAWGTNANATGLSVTAQTLGFANVVSVLYGTNPDLSNAASKQADGRFSAMSPTGINPSLDGLAPSTTYYFQFVGANGPTVVKTAIQSFTTTAPVTSKPNVKEMNASRITKSDAFITCLVENYGMPFSGRFKVGRQPNLADATLYDQQVQSAPAGIWFSKQLSSLAAGTTYYYQAVATGVNGPTESAVQSFTTLAN